MQFDFAALAPKDRYKLMVSTILPRPIAWVVTQSAAGVVNAAPYSFFNGVGGDPPLFTVSIEGRASGGRKDTANNIREFRPVCGQSGERRDVPRHGRDCH